MNTIPPDSSNTPAVDETEVKQPTIPVLGYVIGWGILIAIYFIYQAYVAKDVFANTLDFLIFIGYSMGLFYFNVLFLIPTALKRKRYGFQRLLLYTVLEMVAILVFLVFISLALGGMEFHWDGSFSKVNIINFAGLLFIVFFGLLVSWAYYMVLWGLEQKAKSERKKARNAALMYQNKIHELDKITTHLPNHFVLNTLILLRVTVEREPLISSKCYRCFSEIMRFYSETSLKDCVPIFYCSLLATSTKETAQIVLSNLCYYCRLYRRTISSCSFGDYAWRNTDFARHRSYSSKVYSEASAFLIFISIKFL